MSEDQDSMRFLIMLGKFGQPFESVVDGCDEDNVMGFYGTLDEAQAAVATDDVFQEYGWHIIDNQTGDIHTDDGRVITNPPKWNRETGYNIQ